MDYLRREGDYATAERDAPRPGIILLDLNMPQEGRPRGARRDQGRPELRRIPVVVLTTSKAEEDIARAPTTSGVNSFITKPVTFAGLVEVMQTLDAYWFEIVELPGASRSQWQSAAAEPVRVLLVEDDEDDYVLDARSARRARTARRSRSSGARATTRRCRLIARAAATTST